MHNINHGTMFTRAIHLASPAVPGKRGGGGGGGAHKTILRDINDSELLAADIWHLRRIVHESEH